MLHCRLTDAAAAAAAQRQATELEPAGE
jgi:hypothetical protein